MPSTVYFFKIDKETSESGICSGLTSILTKEDISNSFSSQGFTALKIHFGEADKPNTVNPAFVKVIADAVRKKGGKPFLTDSNTLYTGQRSNAVDHLMCAHRHGYSIKNTGAPAIILDGLAGKSFTQVEINLKHCSTAKIPTDVQSIDDLIGVTHITGHMGAGLGGSIKNIGMGMASRGGKQKQHSGILPEVNRDACTACGECARWCPADAITVEEYASINKDLCIGCGECTVTCQYRALAVRWDESSTNLQENIEEFLRTLVRMRPAAAKGQYVKGITLSSTMGPGVKVERSGLLAALRG